MITKGILKLHHDMTFCYLHKMNHSIFHPLKTHYSLGILLIKSTFLYFITDRQYFNRKSLNLSFFFFEYPVVINSYEKNICNYFPEIRKK